MPHVHPAPLGYRAQVCVPTDNIGVIRQSVIDVPSLHLTDVVARIGSRLLDCTTRVQVTIPAAPPHHSKVFDQWYKAWFHQCYEDAKHTVILGMDGSYKVKGQGISAFVIMKDDVVTHMHTRLIAAHSSYNAEMNAIHDAIQYITDSLSR